MKGKLQNKLIRMLFLISVLPLAVIAVLTFNFLEKISINDAYERVHKELVAGKEELDDIKEDLKYTVRDQNRYISFLLENNEPDRLGNYLSGLIEEENLDFFTVTDAEGKVIFRASNPQLKDDDLTGDLFVRRALEREVTASPEVLSERELRREGLLEKGRIEAVIEKGMVMKAALPIINREEELIGTMSAGYLVNRNYKLIDKIYKSTGLPLSIFIDDIRIASNVQSLAVAPGKFIGTKADADVREQVLQRGERYSGRKEVAGTPYLAAYEPIYNINNEIIGMFGIGIAEKTVFAFRDRLRQIFVIAVFLTMLAAIGFGILGSKGIVKSIDRLRRGTEAISKGDFAYCIDVDSEDEIGELADFFNRMASQLKSAREQLEFYAKDLENKVVQRTAQLEAVHEQLIQFERAAAMGRMASALSHELKNVFTGIQTSAYYLKGKVLREYPRLAESFSDIEKEIGYASVIIADVLSFTRPKKMRLSEVDVNSIIEDILSSPGQKEILKNIEVLREPEPELPRIKADGLQIREVILNLIINAVQAMPAGGRLTLAAKQQEGFLRIEAADTGSGISDENMKKLFTPFFTTKSKGLGLGLSICKEIIERHGGRIEVKTEPGKGTKFIVILPIAQTV
ncbi:MAG: ATP-binding protein [Candidatus Omnitrophota bacterium]